MLTTVSNKTSRTTQLAWRRFCVHRALKMFALCWLVFESACLQAAQTEIKGSESAIWYCSRLKLDGRIVTSSSDAENFFELASFSDEPGVISISVGDLLNAYTGVPVQLGKMKLTACFIDDENLTQAALDSLGMSAVASAELAKETSIVHNHLIKVSSEKQMLKCIARHFPAVGYLGHFIENEESAPCF
jgi:hypothetical protein